MVGSRNQSQADVFNPNCTKKTQEKTILRGQGDPVGTSFPICEIRGPNRPPSKGLVLSDPTSTVIYIFVSTFTHKAQRITFFCNCHHRDMQNMAACPVYHSTMAHTKALGNST